MHFLLTILCILLTPLPSLEDSVMVGKWKLKRKIPVEGPNRCYVDEISFNENNEFELVFKTIISDVVQVYTYSRKVLENGEATLALGDGLAYLKEFNRNNDKVDFRFEYGENLNMFCTREKHPYPHKHIPHRIIGEKLK